MNNHLITLNSLGSNKSTFEVSLSHANEYLSINFLVNSKHHWNLKFDAFLQGYENWGLWHYDVMEVFFQYRKDINDWQGPYYEFQLSPLNQIFFLEIQKPRIQFSYPKDCFITYSSKRCSSNWSGLITIPKRRGYQLYGNITYCLGSPQYFTSWVRLDTPPNFHQPQHFKKF